MTESPGYVTKLQGMLQRLNLVAALRERARLRRLCRTALESCRELERESPESSRTELYSRVVQRLGGVDAEAARKMLRRAEESFAEWPVDRPLNFRDVVQYLAVTDCLRIDIAVQGVRSRFVDSVIDTVAHLIPANL